jgi:hypothetical protein
LPAIATICPPPLTKATLCQLRLRVHAENGDRWTFNAYADALLQPDLDFEAISTQIIEPFIAATWTPARVPDPKVRQAAVVLRAKLLDAAQGEEVGNTCP